jgi:NADH-quinone oxidoreductase subunit J
MTAGNVFFAACTLAALLGAVATVSARNPIRGAMGLLLTIVGIAGLFLKLNAQFLAAIQLIVYAGAVVVLFVFVIMLLGPDAGSSGQREPKARTSRLLAGLLMAAISVLGIALLLDAWGSPQRLVPVGPDHGSVEAVGRQLFIKAIVPFELATALLIVAVVGAIAVARSRHQPQKQKQSPSPTRRMFHGPLMPRDAGRPLTGEEL